MRADLDDLKSRWQRLYCDMPQVAFPDAAQALGLSEAEMLGLAGENLALRLSDAWPELLRQMPRLGRVLCRTSNEASVHERRGVFQQIEFYGDIGVVLGEEIDLRLFMQTWRHGFALTDETGWQAGFQFFDVSGQAILKIFLQAESDWGAFREIVSQFRSSEQGRSVVTSSKPHVFEMPDAEIDTEGFQRAWLRLEDTVYFAEILKEFRVGREQGLRLAPPGHARKVAGDATRQILEGVVNSGLRAMVFVRSSGCLQIHTGEIRGLDVSDRERLDIRDTDFTFHLFLSRVASSWIVRKPTSEGVITSLELFDHGGENIALFFGKRGYGMSENLTWRKLLDSIK